MKRVKLEANGAMEVVHVEQSFHLGPLPPPEHLAAYEKIQPGFADRIVAMAEKQAVHRQGMESAVVRGNIVAQRMGVIAGLIIALAVIALAAYFASLGMGGLSITALLFDLTALVGVFVGAKRAQRRELAKKREQETEAPTLKGGKGKSIGVEQANEAR
ncbi:MAG: DUF2335 domain-containing protein [Planctomycetota bacterium]